MRTVAEKMGVKAGTRAVLVGAPEDAVAAMKLPDLDRAKAMRGMFAYIHLFVRSEREMERGFPKAKGHLVKGGMLWVSWPKGGELTMKDVIRIGYDHGLVESTGLSVDGRWSGLKFTWPKAGKTYHNSYGKLPETRV
jgi:hypothetical protein